MEKLVNGVWVPELDPLEQLRASIETRGKYTATIIRANGDVEDIEVKNVCTYEGLISLLNNQFCGSAQISNWYLGLFSNNYTPVQTDKASTFVSSAGEFTAYSGGTRPPATFPQATTTPSINNGASPATFTMTGNGTIYGAFLTSSSTPGGGSGVLFSAAQFGASKNVGSGDQLILTYTLNAATA